MPQTKLLLTLLTSLTLSAELALPPLATAQTSQQTTAFTITGAVVEQDGSPLYGVIVRAGNAKTMTNAGGRFTLTLATRPEGGRQALTLSAVGKKTQQVTFVEGYPLRVVLEDAVGEIKEVVVRARPNINALDLRARSGVVAQVDMKLLAQKPMIDLSLALQGAVPGLTVVNRGELGMKPEIRIRGNNSFTKGDAANEPLYVLDGKIISPQAFMTLNPLDIREIKVLKDAVATALYGVKAANGVLEISSRRGVSGPMSISLSTQAGVTLRGRQTTTLMDTDEKLELERRMQVTTAPGYLFSPDFISSATLSDLRQSYQSILGIAPTWTREEYLAYGSRQLDSLRQIHTNWWHDLIRPNSYQSHNLSLRGGSQDVTYYVSGNFSRQGGQLEGNDTKRFTLTNSLDWQSRLGFVSLGLTGGYAKTNSPNSSDFSPQQLVYELNPYETKGSHKLYSYPGRKYSDLTGQFRRWTKEIRFGTSLSANLRPFEGMQLDAVLGLDYVLNESEQVTPATAYSEVTRRRPIERGMISVGKNTDFNYSANLRATYQRLFAEKHDFSISANTDYYYNEGRLLSVTGHGIGLQEYLAGVNKGLTSADLRPDFSGSNATSAQLGFGLATGYTYDKKLDLFAAYKADASSLLPRDKRWNTAWALGGGLHLEELLPFLRGGSLLTGLGLKASWGLTASLGGITSASAVPIFSYQQSSFYADQYRLIRLSTLYNDRLKPEQLKSVDLGLSVQLAHAHTLDVNLYRRDTKDALIMTDIPASNGFLSMLDNVGSLRNEGVELSASSRLLSGEDWRLSLRAALAYNRSKVLDLYGKTALYSGDNVYPDYEVGRSYDYVYGLDALGVNPLSGELMFRDRQGAEQSFGKTIVRDDLVGIGYRTPPYTGTFGLTFGYKALELDAQFYYVFGGFKAYSMTYVRGVSDVNKNAIAGQVSRTWFALGDEDRLYPNPRAGTQTFNNLSHYPNTRMISRSDYLRLSMLSLRYRLSSSMLHHLGDVVKYATIALQGSNLFTLTPYKGGSPESGTYDLGVQPVLTLHLNLNF